MSKGRVEGIIEDIGRWQSSCLIRRMQPRTLLKIGWTLMVGCLALYPSRSSQGVGSQGFRENSPEFQHAVFQTLACPTPQTLYTPIMSLYNLISPLKVSLIWGIGDSRAGGSRPALLVET